ncbi:exosortase A [Azoarcus taiwanensis]|uniref:Exosortase A n=1 Tax=Azoarcus taiwanensis TaxID=666964 RepID=A0A972FD05_9RHOO|nr:exosortase A [Azoarcus taiwanensis]NMG03032.1 exosortase A [Azoarcus taiwanensis]
MTDAVPTKGSLARDIVPVVLAILGVFVWLIAWYWPTAHQIAGIWHRSDTYAHGMVVLPVFVWLVWRKREQLRGLTPQPVPWVAVPLALLGFGWLLGQMVSVDGVTHFALIAMISLGLAGVLGSRLARVLLFPILFLFFGLPIGDFLLPVLMHYTAEFTVTALRLSGIPVYQEGLFFIVPNGRWSVIEACSGLRYMHASLFVGALYAYLNYVSLKRRLLFLVVAFVVPIVANWIRAYLIVLVGYLTDNQIAAGADHLIYGWVFFGVVILLMFWIGSFWHEHPPATVAVQPASETVATQRGVRWPTVLPLALATMFFPPLLHFIERPVEPFEVTLALPAPQAGWVLADEPVLGFLPNYQGHRAERHQTYRRLDDGQAVTLYIAYYAAQRENFELVSWRNRLLGREADESRWIDLGMRRDALPEVGTVVHGRLVRNDERRLGVWHWYWSNGRVISSDILAKVFLAVDHLTGQPDDAAFIAIHAEDTFDGAQAREVVASFIRDHASAIERTLEQAEAVR